MGLGITCVSTRCKNNHDEMELLVRKVVGVQWRRGNLQGRASGGMG